MKTNTLEEKPIPDLKDEIIDAIDNNDLLLFIGAGVSKLVEFPLWRELAEKLVNRCVAGKKMSLSDKEVLLSGDFTPMQIVTIASKRLDSINDNYGRDSIVKELGIDYNKDLANKIALFLSAYNSPIITTNADLSLESSKSLSDRIVLNSFEDYNDDYNDTSIIHLHGSIKDPDNMVFTSEKYAQSYMIGNKFGDNLYSLFQKKEWTILFIGYGINEFELLRYFLKEKNEKRKMFLLSGYLEKDQIKLDFDREYYNSLGITLLPFSREIGDYKALVNVLEHWNKDVNERTFAGSLSKKKTIEKIALKKPTKTNVEKIKKMVDKNG